MTGMKAPVSLHVQNVTAVERPSKSYVVYAITCKIHGTSATFTTYERYSEIRKVYEEMKAAAQSPTVSKTKRTKQGVAGVPFPPRTVIMPDLEKRAAQLYAWLHAKVNVPQVNAFLTKGIQSRGRSQSPSPRGGSSRSRSASSFIKGRGSSVSTTGSSRDLSALDIEGSDHPEDRMSQSGRQEKVLELEGKMTTEQDRLRGDGTESVCSRNSHSKISVHSCEQMSSQDPPSRDSTSLTTSSPPDNSSMHLYTERERDMGADSDTVSTNSTRHDQIRREGEVQSGLEFRVRSRSEEDLTKFLQNNNHPTHEAFVASPWRAVDTLEPCRKCMDGNSFMGGDRPITTTPTGYDQGGKFQGDVDKFLELCKTQPLRLRGRAERWELSANEIQIKHRMAQGDGGVIYMARWRGLQAVVKKLRPSGERKGGVSPEMAYKDLINEISLLSHLRHPCLVLFLGAVVSSEPFLVLNEFMPGGNLEDYFRKMEREKGLPHKPPMPKVLQWCMELAQAMCFLHNCSTPIIHRDLKPANLLLCANGHLKVCDFGLSREAVRLGSYNMTGGCGSLRFMAPEVFLGMPVYDAKVDIYSAAMIMWYICRGQRPLREMDGKEIAIKASQEGLRPPLLGVRSDNGLPMANLIEVCWNHDPRKRPSSQELVDELRLISMFVHNLKNMQNRLTDKQMMTVDGLYHQATVGCCYEPSPPTWKFKSRGRWNAWKSLGDMPRHTAKETLIKFLDLHCPGIIKSTTFGQNLDSNNAGPSPSPLSPSTPSLFPTPTNGASQPPSPSQPPTPPAERVPSTSPEWSNDGSGHDVQHSAEQPAVNRIAESVVNRVAERVAGVGGEGPGKPAPPSQHSNVEGSVDGEEAGAERGTPMEEVGGEQAVQHETSAGGLSLERSDHVTSPVLGPGRSVRRRILHEIGNDREDSCDFCRCGRRIEVVNPLSERGGGRHDVVVHPVKVWDVAVWMQLLSGGLWVALLCFYAFSGGLKCSSEDC